MCGSLAAPVGFMLAHILPITGSLSKNSSLKTSLLAIIISSTNVLYSSLVCMSVVECQPLKFVLETPGSLFDQAIISSASLLLSSCISLL